MRVNKQSAWYTSPVICCCLDVCSVVNKIGSFRRTSPSFLLLSCVIVRILAACSVVGFRSLTATSASAHTTQSTVCLYYEAHWVSKQSVCYLHPILTKLEISRHILVKFTNIKNNTEIFSAGAELFRTDGRTDGHA